MFLSSPPSTSFLIAANSFKTTSEHLLFFYTCASFSPFLPFPATVFLCFLPHIFKIPSWSTNKDPLCGRSRTPRRWSSLALTCLRPVPIEQVVCAEPGTLRDEPSACAEAAATVADDAEEDNVLFLSIVRAELRNRRRRSTAHIKHRIYHLVIIL